MSISHYANMSVQYTVQQYFTAAKMVIFRLKNVTFFLFLLKTEIVGTR